jgi:hypothetical protein
VELLPEKEGFLTRICQPLHWGEKWVSSVLRNAGPHDRPALRFQGKGGS